MSARSLIDRLARCRRVAIDQGPFMLYLHGDPKTRELTLALFDRVEQGRIEAVTSTITLTALLVDPLARRNEAVAKELSFLLPTFPHLALITVHQAVAERAAKLQARYGLNLEIGLQAATALVEGAELLVTTEPSLKIIKDEIDVLLLEDCL